VKILLSFNPKFKNYN